MATSPKIATDLVTWVFRAFFLIFMLVATWTLFFPDRYRAWNLRLFDRYRWLASPKLRDKMPTASVARLRLHSGLILIYAAITLLLSLKVLS